MLGRFFVGMFFSTMAMSGPSTEVDWALFAKSPSVTIEINMRTIIVDPDVGSVSFSVRTTDSESVTTEDVAFLCDQQLMISSHRVSGDLIQNDVKVIHVPTKSGNVIRELFNFACPRKPQKIVIA
jgi:hypothetical protein